MIWGRDLIHQTGVYWPHNVFPLSTLERVVLFCCLLRTPNLKGWLTIYNTYFILLFLLVSQLDIWQTWWYFTRQTDLIYNFNFRMPLRKCALKLIKVFSLVLGYSYMYQVSTTLGPRIMECISNISLMSLVFLSHKSLQ